MASPVDSARQGTNISTAATSHNINVGSPVAGTLLIVLVRFAAAPGTVTFTGYTQFATDSSDASDDTTSLYYRWADGTEGATDTLATTNSVKLAAICWEVTGAENPATTAASTSTVVVGTAANINPNAASAPGSLVLDYLTAGGTPGTATLGSAASNQRQAQSFVASGPVQRVAVRLRKFGSPVDNVVVEIAADSAGVPGSVIGSSVTLAGSSITSSFVTYEFVVDAPTSASTTYWIVARRSGAADASNYYVLETAGADVYAGGTRAFYNGTSWTTSTPEARFATYESSAGDLLFLTVIGLDHETATATAPAGYSNTQAANSGTGGAVATNCMIWGASKAATAVTSDDPAAWTSTAPTTGATAWTIAIPSPATPSAPGPSQMYRFVRANRFLTSR